MTQKNEAIDPEIEALLSRLDQIPPRDHKAAQAGRERFMAQARALAPAVSSQEVRRHTGWNRNFFERITSTMKPQFKVFLLAAVVFTIVIAAFFSNTVPTVSAQQILQRASAAQSAAESSPGILHYRIEHYQNPQQIVGERSEATMISETYEDISTGNHRVVTLDSTGKLLDAFASDGSNTYRLEIGTKAGEHLIHRTSLGDRWVKKDTYRDTEASVKALFDQFNNNPRVELLGKETWTGGKQAYILINRNYQTRKPENGEEEKTFTGSTKMIFDAETYALIESETTILEGGKELVIDRVRFMVREVLPAGSPVIWDLSDLGNVPFIDNTAVEESEPKPGIISEKELLKHPGVYVLRPVPEGFTQEIIAAPDQPAGEPYRFEINYRNQAGESFGLQAVGVLGQDFIDVNFYDGSYQSKAGLVLNFSTASREGYTSAVLTTPEENDFLVISTFSREEVEAWVERLVPAG